MKKNHRGQGKNIPAVTGMAFQLNDTLRFVPLGRRHPAAALLSRSGSSISPSTAIQEARDVLIFEHFLSSPGCPCAEHTLSWCCLCFPESVKQGADTCLHKKLKWLLLSHPCYLQGTGICPALQTDPTNNIFDPLFKAVELD